MRVIFMGTPEFSVPVLESLISNEIDICLVVSQPDKKRGRGQKLVYTPVKKTALANNIEVISPENINDCVNILQAYNADMLITCAYGQFLSLAVLNLFEYKINVHASLLPKYRGGAPIHRALINGDKYTGISIMDMISKMDAGDVYAQEKIEISDVDTVKSLSDKLSQVGAKLIIEVIRDFESGNITKIVQDESKVVFSPNIAKSERKIDFNDSAINIYNKVKGLYPDPGSYCMYQDVMIKVSAVVVVDETVKEAAGKIVAVSKLGIKVACNDKYILITKLTMPGKKEVSADQFYNGNKLIEIDTYFS